MQNSNAPVETERARALEAKRLQKQKQEARDRRRHVFFYRLLRPLVALWGRIILGFRCDKIPKEIDNFILMANHNTDADMVLAAMMSRRQIYFIGSEHIFRHPIWGWLLMWLQAPIPRYKSTVATSTVMEGLRRLKKGSNICFFPEGNRSFNGQTNPITPAAGRMVKQAGCAMVTYRFEGGYFVSPRWSHGFRRGRFFGRLMHVYTAEEIKAMTAEEVNAIIQQDLWEDAYERQAAEPSPYTGKHLSLGIENALVLCPKCRKLGTLRSDENGFACSCGLQGRFTETGKLEGEGFSFDTVTQWDRWQRQEMPAVLDGAEGTLFETADCRVAQILQARKEQPVLFEGTVSTDRDGIMTGDIRYDYADMKDIAIYGRGNLLFTLKDGRTIDIKGKKLAAYRHQLMFETLKNA